ncbi:MAG: DciA family protein [Gammaproteobacteria bacterium]
MTEGMWDEGDGAAQYTTVSMLSMARFGHERGAPKRHGPTRIGPVAIGPIAIGELVRAATGGGDAPVLPELLDLKRLDAVIQAAMPEELRAHWRIGRLTGGTLTLFADSPVWAARLRYLAPGLIERLAGRPGAVAVRGIRVKVLVIDAVTPSCKRATTAISRPVSDYLRQAAEGFGDARLRAALLNLSRHGPG